MEMAIRAIQCRRMALGPAIEYISSFNFPEDEIIVLPEKFITTTVDENSIKKILNSIKIKNTIILGSLSYFDHFLYNRSFLIQNREIIGWQDKINLYSAENTKYAPGSELKLFEINGIKIGILVCYDLDFPDYARALFRKHCDIIFNPSLIRKDFHNEWHLYVKSRSLENRIPIISVNSISDNFQGESIIVRPVAGEGGVRINITTSKGDDIIARFNTADYLNAREQRLDEENIMLGKVKFLECSR